MSSISLASGGTPDISTRSNEEKYHLIHSLQQEMEILKERVEEFNSLTAIDCHDSKIFFELLWRIISPQIHIKF